VVALWVADGIYAMTLLMTVEKLEHGIENGTEEGLTMNHSEEGAVCEVV